MVSFSIYSVNDANHPKWRPGEEIAAAAFLGITFYLFLEVNLLLFRAFRRRQGLYFWSMQIGTIGVLIDAIGVILKYFVATPRTDKVWPLSTLFMVVGWGTYSTAQSLVLYSRLHLVMQNRKIQRYVLYMIVCTVFIFIGPHLVLVWPAYNASDYTMAAKWSPREAIVQRYTQLGYTITESIISGLYIWSLVPLLRLKSNVRQRRVMTDLIYVNIIVIAFDILQVGFVYTNRLGFSQSIPSFSYILKLRLEFAVLNQLMNVAARGMRRGRNRYYRNEDTPIQEAKDSHLMNKKDSSNDGAHTTRAPSTPIPDPISSPKSTFLAEPTTRSESDGQISGLESNYESNSLDQPVLVDRRSLGSDGKPLKQKAKRGTGFFRRSPHTSKDSKHVSSQGSGRWYRSNSGDNEDEDSEEEVELQRWDRRGGSIVVVPWFRSKVQA